MMLLNSLEKFCGISLVWYGNFFMWKCVCFLKINFNLEILYGGILWYFVVFCVDVFMSLGKNF